MAGNHARTLAGILGSHNISTSGVLSQSALLQAKNQASLKPQANGINSNKIFTPHDPIKKMVGIAIGIGTSLFLGLQAGQPLAGFFGSAATLTASEYLALKRKREAGEA